MVTSAGVTRRKNARYGNEYPLTSNGIQAEIHCRNNDRHNYDERTYTKMFVNLHMWHSKQQW
jgi:hypothetical protein